MNSEMITYLTQSLMKEAQIIANEFRSNGQNISTDILATKLNEFLTQMKYQYQTKGSYELPDFNSTNNPNLINDQQSKYSKEPSTSKTNNEPMTNSNYPMNSEQQNIDWYYIKPYATYYQDPSIDHSLALDNQLESNSNRKKILVNVINNKSSSKPIKTKKRIYSSPSTIIGSQTMEDLFQVINNQKSKSLTERVIIVDRYNSNSKPVTANSISIVPATGYMIQQPIIYTSMPSNIYLTTTTTSYIANANNYYPFVYYQY